jgi:hypothetical protein
MATFSIAWRAGPRADTARFRNEPNQIFAVSAPLDAREQTFPTSA